MLNCIMLAASWSKHMFNKFLRDEKGEVNIVATVVLIGVAVVLAILFKDAIGGLLTKLLGDISGKTDKVFTEITTQAPETN